MWKDYSIGFIKKNRASSVSVLVAAFISALFLSLLCGLFYNFWNYEIESVVLEEGNWQGRISGALEEDELSEIENFANVKTVAINEDLSDEQTLVVDICFDDMRAVYQDMPLIAQQLGVPETSVSYHESLLSSYFINDPQNSNPPLLMAFYLFVLLLVSVSLILIIHNSFAVSMNARVHQFGIFSSIGATPGQIRTCLLQEAAMLCVLPILLGSFVGIALTFGAIQAVNILADGIVGRHEAAFTYHPLVFAVTILTSFLTVLNCGVCGRKMTRHSYVKHYADGSRMRIDGYFCLNGGATKTDSCPSSNRIPQNVLTDILFSLLEKEFDTSLKKKRIYLDKAGEIIWQKKQELERSLRSVTYAKERLAEEESDKYMAYRMGNLSQKDYVEYKMCKENRLRDLEKQEKNFREQEVSLERDGETYLKAVRVLIKLKNEQVLTRELIESLIDKIYVYPGKRVEVLFTYSDALVERQVKK